MTGSEFTVFMRDAPFLECLGDGAGPNDLHEFVAPTVEDPDFHVLEVGYVPDVGGACKGDCGSKEVGAFVDEMPDPVASQ